MVNELMLSFCRKLLNTCPLDQDGIVDTRSMNLATAIFDYALEGDDLMSNMEVTASTAYKFMTASENVD